MGFGPQRRSDNEARSSVRRWDLAPGKQCERAGVSRTPVGFGWRDLLLRMQPAPR